MSLSQWLNVRETIKESMYLCISKKFVYTFISGARAQQGIGGGREGGGGGTNFCKSKKGFLQLSSEITFHRESCAAENDLVIENLARKHAVTIVSRVIIKVMVFF
jgi:hypothetical protein